MKKKPIIPFNVILWDINRDNVEYYDIMPYIVSCWEEEKKKKHKIWVKGTEMPKTFEEVKKFILDCVRYRYWSRCEYEIIIHAWPAMRNEEKIDAFDQVEANIEVITVHFINWLKENKEYDN